MGNRNYDWETAVDTTRSNGDKEYLLDDSAQNILNELRKVEIGNI
jgi:hypothetical protein